MVRDSRTRKGGWAVAQSPIPGTTVTPDRLKKRGYESTLELYQRIAPHLNEPPYTCPFGQAGETRLVYAELAEVYSGASACSAEL